MPPPNAAKPVISASCRSGSTRSPSALPRSPAGAIPTSTSRSTAAGAISPPGVSSAQIWSRPGADRSETARARIDLAIVSVLLDAGAGPHWRYRESGNRARPCRAPRGWRSPACGRCRRACFRPTRQIHWRADAAALLQDQPRIARRAHFSTRPGNELAGLDGRAALLRRLGEVVAARAGIVRQARPARQPDDYWHAAAEAAWPPPEILALILRASRADLAGPAYARRGVRSAIAAGIRAVPGDGLVPLHKLSQWLAYSLVEPLARSRLADRRSRRTDRARRIPQWRAVPRRRRAGAARPGPRRAAARSVRARRSSNGGR